jgi:hypothetical protein
MATRLRQADGSTTELWGVEHGVAVAGYDFTEGVLKTAGLIWNTGSLTWEKATGSGGAGNVTVTNFPATYDVSDRVGRLLGSIANLFLLDATFTARINTQGQKTMAGSTPVVLPSDQSAVPVNPTAETAGVGVGAAADAEASGNGSVIGILKRLRTLLGGLLLTDLRRGQTILFAAIDVAASGDNTIVAADATRKIKVLAYNYVCDGTVAVRWKSGAGTNLSGAKAFVANTGLCSAVGTPAGGHLLETAVNQALVLNLSAAIGVRGELSYFLEA